MESTLEPRAIRIPAARPFLACTADELARLRTALKSNSPDAAPVVDLIKQAETALKNPINFPPRGGQHNQWYQCDPCQVALKTIDDTHHQCPRCQRVYSGEPYDDVIFSRTHYANLRRGYNAAWAYAVTGRAEFAADARAVLLGYAERYLQYPYHDNARGTKATGGHINEQTLGEAHMMATLIAPALDLLHDSAALADADRARIKDGLIRPMLANIAKYKAGKSNWQSWHNAALFAGGALVGDEALMRFTLEDPQHGFMSQMKVSVSDEGMWYENSWSYHAYTLSALTQHAEYARRCGIDLWAHASLRKMFLLPMRYTMPDGSLPRFGDAVGASAGLNVPDAEAAYAAYRDDALLPMLPGRPNWLSVMHGRDAQRRADRPALPSEVFPGAGHAIMRTRGTSGGAGLAAVITFGPYGGFHGHFDKLSFVLFGHGRELAVDPGRAASQAYRLPIHNHWYKATISHNAVLVDGKPQAPAEGKLLSFAANDQHAIAVASCDKAYEGVTHRRLLYVGPEYALVVDDLEADNPRQFDWLYHNRGKSVTVGPFMESAATRPTTLAGAIPIEKIPGQEYIKWASHGGTIGSIRATVIDDPVRTHLIAAGGEPTEVHAGDGVGASIDDRVPVVMLRRTGQRMVFAVAIEPRRDNAPPSIKSVIAEREGDRLMVTVDRGAAKKRVVLDANGMGTVGTDAGAVLVGKAR